MFEHLYDVSEEAKVQFVGFTTDSARYDFALVFTHQFFGKPLVICMQTGRSSLLSIEDADDLEGLQRAFTVRDTYAAEELRTFLLTRLPPMKLLDQY